MKNLLFEYESRKKEIKSRVEDFKKNWNKDEKFLFSELCFCICTPQSKAVLADKAINYLVDNGKLFNGTVEEIREGLRGVRFPNNKSGYIYEANQRFIKSEKADIRRYIDAGNIRDTREWFARNVKGIGFKEASHFLRNIGQGSLLAILDVHILNKMVEYRVIEQKPKTISPAKYIELENRFFNFADQLEIPAIELDLLLWSIQTGRIFK